MRKLTVAVVVAALLGACGGSSPEPAEEAAAAPAEPFLIEIIGDDFSYEMPETVPAGPIQLQLENVGVEPHQALVYKLEDGLEYDDYVAAVMADDSQVPALSERIGGVNYGVPSGKVELYTESDPYEPGSYVAICFIRDGETGKGHFELGMIAPFTVE